MSDFCHTCSIYMFGEDYGDMVLAKNDPKRGTLPPDHGWRALCESCGGIVVDDDGTCMSHTAEEHEALFRSGSHP